MSTQPALRPEENHELPQSDRRYRIEPEIVAQLTQGAKQQASVHASAAEYNGLPGLIARVLAAIRLWRERAQSRRDLAGCDRRMLRDIGVSPIDAGREVGKPFWRA